MFDLTDLCVGTDLSVGIETYARNLKTHLFRVDFSGIKNGQEFWVLPETVARN